MGDPTPRYHGAVTDVGRQRQTNEDSLGTWQLPDGSMLLVVCDGMGGHEAGEVASAIAVEKIGAAAKNPGDPREQLYNGFISANSEIIRQGQEAGKRGMGTTGVAAIVRGSEVFVAHVGDSRLYQIRGKELVFRTKDHTRVQKMVDMGILTPAQAKEHPDANVITRALGHPMTKDGGPLEPDVRTHPLTLEQGDALLLCSDGLYDLVEDHELAPMLAGRTPTEAAQALVDLANARGGDDNITVSVLYFGFERSTGAVAAPPPSVPRVTAPPSMPSTTPPTPASPQAPPTAKRSVLPFVVIALGVVLLAGVVFVATRPEAPGDVDAGMPPTVVASTEPDASTTQPAIDAGVEVASADAGLAPDAGAASVAVAADAGTPADAGVPPVVPAQAPKPAANRPAKTEPAKTEPAKAEPAKTEPAKTEPAKTDPAKTDPAKTDPAKAEPAKTEPAKTEPAKAEPAKTEPAKTDGGTSTP